MSNLRIEEKRGNLDQGLFFHNLGIKKNKLLRLFLLMGILLINVLVGLLYDGRINNFTYGTKWHQSGLNYLVLLEEQLVPFLGYCLFIVIAYMLLIFYDKLHEQDNPPVVLFNIVLLFVVIVSLNDLIKLLGAGLIGFYDKAADDLNLAIQQLKGIKNFATGLDLFINLRSSSGLVRGLLESVNVFSVIGAVAINSQLKKVKENNLPIVLAILVAFIVINTFFGALSLNSFVLWND